MLKMGESLLLRMMLRRTYLLASSLANLQTFQRRLKTPLESSQDWSVAMEATSASLSLMMEVLQGLQYELENSLLTGVSIDLLNWKQHLLKLLADLEKVVPPRPSDWVPPDF